MKNVYDIKLEKSLDFILPLEHKIKEQDCERGSVLIVVHLHYLETVDEYIKYIDHIPDEMDLIFTISDECVRQRLQEIKTKSKKKDKILEKRNRGRDISSFLVTCRREILKHEYICFLHDKKEKGILQKADTEKWIRSLWENMIGSSAYIDNVLYTFNKNPQLGLLVPPFPVSENFSFSLYTDAWQGDFEVTRNLANEMNLQCELDSSKQPITLGTVFWAKVSALKKLFEIEWKYEDFPEEPLENDGTISHAIERILAYVAQDLGFETGWVMTDRYAGEEFEYTQMVLRKSFERLTKSLDIRNISELDHYEKRIERLSQFANTYDCLYIYGAGIRGKRYLSLLKMIQKKPAAFLVSDRCNNPTNIYEIPVYSISEIDLDENSGIIVGVSEQYQEEILSNIKKKNRQFCNIYID